MNSKQSIAPIAAMFAAVVLTVGVGPRLISIAAGRPLEPDYKVSATAGVYLEFAQVESLLKTGKTAEAKQLLDRIGGETLIVEGSTGGDGALQTFSPVTLLVQVTRQMLKQAQAEAKRGNTSEAMGWIGRCRELSAQVLATSRPNLDSLHTARSIDSLTGREEIAIRKSLHDEAGAQTVAAREERVNRFYQTTIHTKVNELPDQIGSSGASQTARALMDLYQSQRLHLAAILPGNGV